MQLLVVDMEWGTRLFLQDQEVNLKKALLTIKEQVKIKTIKLQEYKDQYKVKHPEQVSLLFRHHRYLASITITLSISTMLLSMVMRLHQLTDCKVIRNSTTLEPKRESRKTGTPLQAMVSMCREMEHMSQCMAETF